MQKIPIVFSESFLLDESNFSDDTSKGLQAIVTQIASSPFKDCIQWIKPSEKDYIFWLKAFYSNQYLSQLESLAQSQNNEQFETSVSQNFLVLARLAVDISSKYNASVFVLTHSLERSWTNLDSLAVHYALVTPSLNRVAILDWNIAHNRKIQELVQNNPNLAYCSISQDNFWSEARLSELPSNFDNVLNIPLTLNHNFSNYQIAFVTKILPFLKSFSSDLLIVNLGIEAQENKLNSGLKFQSKDFYDLSKHILSITPKVVFGLEEKYKCTKVGQSVLEAIKACCCYSAKSKIIQQFIVKQNFYL